MSTNLQINGKQPTGMMLGGKVVTQAMLGGKVVYDADTGEAYKRYYFNSGPAGQRLTNEWAHSPYPSDFWLPLSPEYGDAEWGVIFFGLYPASGTALARSKYEFSDRFSDEYSEGDHFEMDIPFPAVSGVSEIMIECDWQTDVYKLPTPINAVAGIWKLRAQIVDLYPNEAAINFLSQQAYLDIPIK